MNQNGKQYWRSLEELSDTPQFREWLHREFPENASEMTDSTSRRTLLKLMAASFGLAGLTACSRPVEKILPASQSPEHSIPGNPLYYSTVISLGGYAAGLLVEAHEGRPTKIEGNPEHPSSRGAASAFAQGSLLGLYDPDRSKTVLKDGRTAGWNEFHQFAKAHFAPPAIGSGERLRFLSQTVNSPSFEAVRAHALRVFPAAKWVEYEPLSRDEALAGAELAFGRPVETHYRFDRADVVISLDCDFLGLDVPSVVSIRDFAGRRRVESGEDSMNRLYVVESQYSITGAMADHRRRMRSGEVRDFAFELARELNLAPNGLSILQANPSRKFVAAVARDLNAHRGRCLVVAGPRQPAVVHALAHWMNQALGNVGKTVHYTETAARPQLPALKDLVADIAAGGVDTLVILGGNPAYNAPADLDFTAHLKKVPTTIHLGLEADETAALAKWHLPEAHYLESWGDGRALDGTASLQQPLIRPLYDGRTTAEVLAAVSGYKDQRAYDIVRNYWTAQWPAAESEKKWRRSLHDGVIRNTALANVQIAVDTKRVAAARNSFAQPAAKGLEITFVPSAGTYDGRFANNGWMQEAPDPITKLTWDNAALISPATARALGLELGDVVALQREGRELEAPVFVLPGHADNSISLALGYGRTRAGRVGKGVGHDSYRIRTSSGFHFASDVSIRRTGRKHQFAVTQEHHSLEGRPLVREATLEEYREDPHAVHKAAHGEELFSIYGEHSYAKGNQWGMAIDLNACIGCNACLVACQAENNIPIVGKDQVRRGREMHWIRMDRYFSGGEDDPQVLYQPVACQQCETAPCESVCPVAATSHSSEGLNDMVYNRCVGTRYCANNCPYKVRRFNFLDWHKGSKEVETMVFNPDVTVRMRGVMEKCTYCVQRIEEVKARAKLEGRRPIRDGEIKTACQQTCPAEAIVFGNINDPNSRVSKLKQQDRDYAMLGELNTRPRTTYLAKLRNPNPELA
jgi:molybdopterin-containing oxidoreductase family iron-sulfur binding subunit